MGSTPEQNAQWRERRKGIPCSVGGCENGSTGGRGYCPAHYRRWRQGLPLDAVTAVRRKNVGPCDADGCERPSHSRGWCRTHYARFRRTGAVAARPKRPNGQGSCDESTKGYHVVSVSGKRRAAHRVAMEELLGRPLARRETVHHVNGRRSDNRTDGPLDERYRSGNLELWSSWQPSGQRVSDKVAYAVELLREYAPHLLASAAD